ncbi:MAG: Mandelate racemase/muconate lactonizing protein, partial [Caulobacteraceae bacterium]|nr:Mandelate racemase/muconate lactonizing protein [Caulobacteraceae bacterium]
NLTVTHEVWPLAQVFTIARGSKSEASVVVVHITSDTGLIGRGESVPYARYGESIGTVMAEIEDAREVIERGAGREIILGLMTPGAARSAVDCALWDMASKRSGRRAWEIAGLEAMKPVETCYTLSLDTPEAMGAAALAQAARPWLKLKLGGADDLARVEAVRAAAPRAKLMVDANEALSFDELVRLAPDMAKLGVVLIEQPLKAGQDFELEGWKSPVPLCADESLHTRHELGDCARRYQAINIKLDKAGGLTEGLALVTAARQRGLDVIAGCMVATSLSMAPAMLIAQQALIADLDGPLLLARDREHGLVYEASLILPPSPELWG